MYKDDWKNVLAWTFALLVVVGLIVGGFRVFPEYRVWSQEMRGKAALAEAQWDRQIRVEEAQAELEAAKLDAQAEAERARGLAEANQILGDSLKGNSEYLTYLWLQAIDETSVVYVPTEAQLPILEANRFLINQPALDPAP